MEILDYSQRLLGKKIAHQFFLDPSRCLEIILNLLFLCFGLKIPIDAAKMVSLVI